MGKVAIVNNKEKRDDEHHRLFLLVKAEYGLCVKDVMMLKPYVWMIDTDEGKWVLKGYPTFFEAARQLMFISSLKQAGFQAAPSVKTTMLRSGIVYFQKAYWMLQAYIPHIKTLAFTDDQDRADGLALLREYHSFSQQVLRSPFFTMAIPRYHLYEKWRQRYVFFLSHLSLMKRIIPKNELSFILQCADYCLRHFPRFAHSLATEGITIIHGDVASHNFLRTEQGNVYLIDYDLIAIAPPSIDYLQYASRILPHMQWSLARLEQIPLFQSLLEKPWFLHALIFPADVMRECRFLLRTLTPFTIPHFEHRKQFVQKIIDMVR
jgi:hypothetical protein